MEISCQKCKAHLFKSYGSTYKLRSRSIRWDSPNGSAVVQCNMCRSLNELPITLKIQPDSAVVLEVGTEVKKSAPKEKLIVAKEAKKSEKERN